MHFSLSHFTRSKEKQLIGFRKTAIGQISRPKDALQILHPSG
jgi:hypothetical protein